VFNIGFTARTEGKYALHFLGCHSQGRGCTTAWRHEGRR